MSAEEGVYIGEASNALVYTDHNGSPVYALTENTTQVSVFHREVIWGCIERLVVLLSATCGWTESKVKIPFPGKLITIFDKFYILSLVH